MKESHRREKKQHQYEMSSYATNRTNEENRNSMNKEMN